MQESGTDSSTAWIVTDGSAGMENQCIGLAEAMDLPFVVKRIATTKPWRWLPPQLWVSPLSRLKEESDPLQPPWPDILITCGRQAIPMSLAIRHASAGRTFTVHIQTPNTSPRHFDLLIVPEHDTLRGSNILVSRGSLTRITGQRLAAEAARFEKRLHWDATAPVVTVLIGGSNRCYRVNGDTMRGLCARLEELHRSTGCHLLVTTSRRTGAENVRILQQTLKSLPHTLWDGNGDNPYFAFLHAADAIVVTADSANMVSEAASTGKPVLVYPLPGGNAKFRRFHSEMEKHNHTRPFTGRLDRWTPPQLAETRRLAATVREKWQAHRRRMASQM